MQKCIKSQIYTPFLILGEPPWNFTKKFRRETLKNEVFRKSILTPLPSTPLENRFWLPSTPLDPVPIYAVGKFEKARDSLGGQKWEHIMCWNFLNKDSWMSRIDGDALSLDFQYRSMFVRMSSTTVRRMENTLLYPLESPLSQSVFMAGKGWKGRWKNRCGKLSV